ncbi:MAG: hypothetical protein RBS39_08800, partial [Phycisphaerales bacterium]|nr:hypothetical protein [Phycisphaerales bacterium]
MVERLHITEDAGGRAARGAVLAPMGAAPDAGTSTDAARPAAQAEPKLGVHASLRVVAVVPSHGRAPDVVAVLGDLARVPREV